MNAWSPLRLRAISAAQLWIEGGGDLRDLLGDWRLERLLELAVADASDDRGRDLDASEVASVCEATVANAVAEREERAAKHAAHLQRIRASALLHRDDDSPPPGGTP